LQNGGAGPRNGQPLGYKQSNWCTQIGALSGRLIHQS
jgi:hypothetical protein